MDVPTMLREVQARLSAAGISTAQACRRAEIHAVTVSRWKAGHAARPATLQRFVAAAEALLAERQAAGGVPAHPLRPDLYPPPDAPPRPPEPRR